MSDEPDQVDPQKVVLADEPKRRLHVTVTVEEDGIEYVDDIEEEWTE